MKIRITTRTRPTILPPIFMWFKFDNQASSRAIRGQINPTINPTRKRRKRASVSIRIRNATINMSVVFSKRR